VTVGYCLIYRQRVSIGDILIVTGKSHYRTVTLALKQRKKSSIITCLTFFRASI